MKRIGILGGTFNPPHIGHLIIAEQVRSALQLEEIWFIPTYQSPHKGDIGVNAKLRKEMIELAIDDHPVFQLNTVEIDRQGKSYTIDTLKTFNQMYPSTSFYFIIGADMVEYLPNWYQIDELLTLVTFVGVKRPGHELKTSYPIVEVEVPSMDISSTQIRNNVKEKKSIRYLVPEKVRTLIKEYQLYEH